MAFCRPGMTNWLPWLKPGLSSATLLTILTGASVMYSVLIIRSKEFNFEMYEQRGLPSVKTSASDFMSYIRISIGQPKSRCGSMKWYIWTDLTSTVSRKCYLRLQKIHVISSIHWNDRNKPSLGYSFSDEGVIGHYTQIVWASTSKIGCGIMQYFDNTTVITNLPYKMVYVCNYGPAGNLVNAPVYTTGPAASACPAGTVPKNGLCA